MTSTATVSIIITCYNYGHFLQECVESVLVQDYPHWEAIIVDDGSTDNSEDVARTLVSRCPAKLRYLKLENGGVSRARNIGIEHTSGEYILPLDADDILLPSALSDYVQCIESDPNYGFAYGCLDMLGNLPGEPTQWLPGPFSWKLFRFENLASVTSLWKRSLFEDGVHFREGFFFEDWDLWLQVIERGCPGGYVPVPTFQCRTHLDGRTSFARYFHTQGLAQQIEANKKLFSSQENRMYAETVLHTAPESYAKPTFLFCTPQDPKVSGEYITSLAPLLEHLVHEKYFVAVFGNANQVPHVPKGVYVINLQDEWADKILATQAGCQGKNTIVISHGRAHGILRGLHQQLSISLVVSHGEHIPGISDYTLKYLPSGILVDSPGVNIFDPPVIHSTLKSFSDWLAARATERHERKKEAHAEHRKKQLALANAHVPSGNQNFTPDKNDASIIVPTRNVEPARLRRCLESIRNSSFQSSLPIIVSDYGSHTDSLAKIRSVCSEFGATLIESHTREPWSRSRALNIGARHATTKWLIFTDADMIFSPQLLACWEMYRASFGETSFYLAQCKKLPPIQKYPDQITHASYAELSSQGRLFENYGHGGFQVIERKMFHTVGGFNESYTLWGSEDSDLSTRLEALGKHYIWLHPGLLLHQWHIKDVDEAQAVANREHFDEVRLYNEIHPNDSSWGQITTQESKEYESFGPLPLEQESRSKKLESAMLSEPLSDAELIDCLIAWGQDCLTRKQVESAAETFEDILTLDQNNIIGLMGLSSVYTLRGSLQRAAHLAYLILRKDPTNEHAKNILSSIRDTYDGYYAYIDNKNESHVTQLQA